MGEVLAFVGLGVVLVALVWGKSLASVTNLTTFTQSSIAPMLPAGVTPTALGIAPDLIVSVQTSKLLRYGIDPVVGAAFPVTDMSWRTLRVQPLTDGAQIAMSFQLNPELAQVAAALKG